MEHGFGIIGAGEIACVHARAINSIKNASLVGVTDINAGRASDFSRQYGCIAFDKTSSLVSSPDIDIICICTPPGNHLEPALEAIAAGKHCIIEKPLEVTLSRCDTIIKASGDNHVLVAGIFPMRFLDIYREIKKASENHRFGKMVLGDVYVKWLRSQSYFYDVPWRGNFKISGGGVIMNQAIHSIDLLRWIMGEVVEVNAFSATIGHSGIDVEDTSIVNLRFENGALGVIEASTAIYPGAYKRLEILGTDGSVVIEEEKIITWRFKEENDEDRVITQRFTASNKQGGGVSDPRAISDLGHIRQISDMIRAVETGCPPFIDAVEARKTIEIVIAVYESALTGKTVSLKHN